MKNKLKWRLPGKLPTSEEVRELVKASLITKEEAREILFNEETEETIEVDNLKAEIKFLRETVEKLADKQTIRTVIQEIIPRYINYPVYQPYYSWSYTPALNGVITCGGKTTTYGTLNVGGTTDSAYTIGTNMVNCSATGYSNTADTAFTDIKTF